MDDLNDDPHKVAEDIIREALQGDKSEKEATERLVNILNCYQQLQQEIAEPKGQKESETDMRDIRIEGALAWIFEEGDEKRGPFCARCYINDKEFKLMLEIQKGLLWECPRCGKRFNLSAYDMRDDDGDDSGSHTWLDARR